jgi:hypothetical protein
LHLSPGKGDNALFEAIRERLAEAPGVRRVAVKPSTAVVIVEYDPAMAGNFRHSLAEFAKKDNLFVFAPANDGLPPPHSSVTDRKLTSGSGFLNRALQAGTGNLISLKEALPIGMLAWAAIFVDPATAAAQWLSWVAFAWNIYFDTHQDEPARELSQQLKTMQVDIAAVRRLLENKSQFQAGPTTPPSK